METIMWILAGIGYVFFALMIIELIATFVKKPKGK